MFRFSGWGRRAALAAVTGLLMAASAQANHSWNGFHWARSSNPFTLTLGDNVSSTWDGYLATTASDWGASSVVNTRIVPGLTKPKPCKATTGRVEVCNDRYGNNGWLGLAQVWINGTHIVAAITKVNDTYFAQSPYNTSAWRNMVMCQEVGHTLGLDHQDENFNNANLGSCMDYTNNPSTNQHPNAHDYQELEIIYNHLDGAALVSAEGLPEPGAAAADGPAVDGPEAWGRLTHQGPGGRQERYELDLGNGKRMVTFVIWAGVFDE